ncbi:MAG: MBL fold metallo-hydrolase [Leptospiraceae bacterium]|nr:FprA family A-type flavoprotein [Leptospiraceae bacterium]MCK6381669.1 MBL fold metallo-hydrolase [Leptospiraceae bacterium]NUM40437.1 FprA family A-type flavoprotein [Leptospiraceae bacterium]
MEFSKIQELNQDSDRFAGSVIYSDSDHKFIWLGMEKHETEGMVHVNQYLIVHKGKGVLIDAGGITVFPQIVSNLCKHINISDLDILFYSHQDPDVSSGIALWENVSQSKFYIGAYWAQFLPHFGLKDTSRIVSIPDEGSKVYLDDKDYIEFVPAHFLHSISNYTLYDSRSKILFSGDIGAALFPPGERYVAVENFQEHVKLMTVFHQRFMASNKACKKWTDRLKGMDIEAIVPQHGAIFFRQDIPAFLDWFSKLQCGVDLF